MPPLVVFSWPYGLLFLVVLMSAILVVYGYRVGVEERVLAATIREPYRRYMTRTKRFVPFVF